MWPLDATNQSTIILKKGDEIDLNNMSLDQRYAFLDTLTSSLLIHDKKWQLMLPGMTSAADAIPQWAIPSLIGSKVPIGNQISDISNDLKEQMKTLLIENNYSPNNVNGINLLNRSKSRDGGLTVGFIIPKGRYKVNCNQARCDQAHCSSDVIHSMTPLSEGFNEWRFKYSRGSLWNGDQDIREILIQKDLLIGVAYGRIVDGTNHINEKFLKHAEACTSRPLKIVFELEEILVASAWRDHGIDKELARMFIDSAADNWSFPISIAVRELMTSMAATDMYYELGFNFAGVYESEEMLYGMSWEEAVFCINSDDFVQYYNIMDHWDDQKKYISDERAAYYSWLAIHNTYEWKTFEEDVNTLEDSSGEDSSGEDESGEDESGEDESEEDESGEDEFEEDEFEEDEFEEDESGEDESEEDESGEVTCDSSSGSETMDDIGYDDKRVLENDNKELRHKNINDVLLSNEDSSILREAPRSYRVIE